MKLTDEINAVLTEEERTKYVKGDELLIEDDHEALIAFMPRYFAALHKHILKRASELKKLYPEAFDDVESNNLDLQKNKY